MTIDRMREIVENPHEMTTDEIVEIVNEYPGLLTQVTEMLSQHLEAELNELDEDAPAEERYADWKDNR